MLDACAWPCALDAGQRMRGSVDADAGPLLLDAGQRALDADSWPCALDAGPRVLDAGTIWQDMQGYIGVFWIANGPPSPRTMLDIATRQLMAAQLLI